MTVVAPSTDPAGTTLDAQITTVQTLVTANANAVRLYAYQQQLNQLQVAAVDHYMVTGWLNAATILATYQPATWDRPGQTIAARVAALQALVNNPPVMPPGDAGGYGGSGWTTIAAAYQQMLYAKQIELVEHLMNTPGGIPAATMLAVLTGSQSFPFEYVFNSVGYTDAWIED